MSNVSVTSPVTGVVVEVSSANGTPVHAHQIVLVLESMKMQMPITAPADGIVAGMPLSVGDTVEEGGFLFAIMG